MHRVEQAILKNHFGLLNKLWEGIFLSIRAILTTRHGRVVNLTTLVVFPEGETLVICYF